MKYSCTADAFTLKENDVVYKWVLEHSDYQSSFVCRCEI